MAYISNIDAVSTSSGTTKNYQLKDSEARQAIQAIDLSDRLVKGIDPTTSAAVVGALRSGDINNNVASGLYSHAEGTETTASGQRAHAEGKGTSATANGTHAEGYYSAASGSAAHAEGCNTVASGVYGSHAEGNVTVASGQSAHAEGEGWAPNGVIDLTYGASGQASHSEGSYTKAQGNNSHAEGEYTIASGIHSHAEGLYTTASGKTTHSEGEYTIANHKSQHVFGEYNVADPSNAATSARGNYIEIVGKGSISARSNARTLDWSGNETLAGKLTVGAAPTANMDVATKQYVDNSINSEAGKNIPYGYCETADDVVAKTVTVSPSITELATGLTILVKFQYANTATNPTLNVNNLGAVAIKRYGTTAAGTSAATSWNSGAIVAIIYDGTNWVLNDWNNATYSGMSDAEYQAGTSTTNRLISPARLKSAIEFYANASKWTIDNDGSGSTSLQATIQNDVTNNVATGTYSHAEGQLTTASGNRSHAEGKNTIASASDSHAEGYQTCAVGYQAHAEGIQTTAGVAGAPMYGFHAEGNVTLSTGQASHAEGLGTTAAAEGSHSEGHQTSASGGASHAEGGSTTASGGASHAEGSNTNASGGSAHAEGCNTVASGVYGSHAEGEFANASGRASHAEGYYTISNHRSQHVFGEYNTADDSTAAATARGNYIEIVGNGTATSARANARILDWSGNESLAGSLTLGMGTTAAITLTPAILNQLINSGGGSTYTNVTLSSNNWTLNNGTGYYTQSVTVQGVTSTSRIKINGLVYPSGTTLDSKLDIDYSASLLLNGDCGTDTITFSAVDMPSVSFTLELEVK